LPNLRFSIGKQETRKLHLFTSILHGVLPTNTQNTLEISPGHRWTTLHCQNDRLHALNMTYRKGDYRASCSTLPSRLTFTEFTVTVPVELFFIKAGEKVNRQIAKISYYLNNLLDAIKRAWLMTISSFNKIAALLRATQQLLQCKLSTSFLFSYDPVIV